MKFTLSIAFLSALVAAVVASPVEVDPSKSYACANEAGDVCPKGYTCCGPIRPDVGGNCRKLPPDMMCML
ncbi:hypothetical protein BKA70DRAFT_1262159 [Coprinopsis sp. MPI-PUGE-AT-0042]|nr:hypothetical protein BKA70DRAFT_1262159 [Coprinopsis sp. MPI-PUGE-AT-0042]